jgi:adenylylsulfate kinase
VVRSLKDNGLQPIFLDGDDLRSVLGISGTDFSREERLRLAFIYADLCRYIASQGAVVVIATIALFKEIHNWNRTNLPNYLEVFIDIPLEVLEERDSKGLYESYRKGKIQHVAGLDFEVDFPTNPDVMVGVEVPNHQATASKIVNRILESQVDSV